MTDPTLAAIIARHHKRTYPNGAERCTNCCIKWPCDAIRLVTLAEGYEVQLRDKDESVKLADNAVERLSAEKTQLESRVRALQEGNCLKCNMGPLLGACAYPEACEHLGRELVRKLNQVLLDLTTARAEVALLLEAAAEDSGLSDASVRYVVLGLNQVREHDIEWARQKIKELGQRATPPRGGEE